MTAADETLVAQLQASDDGVRIAAMHALTAGDISPAVRAHLRTAIMSPCAEIRLAAIQCWQRCACMTDAVVMAATFDSDADVRAAAYAVVLEWPCPEWLATYQRGSTDESVHVRLAVVRTLAAHAQLLPPAVRYACLRDADKRVACKAAELLAKHHDNVAIAWLMARLTQSNIVHKRLVIRALGYARVPAAVPLLMHEVQRRTPCMLCSIDALGHIAAPDSMPLLLVLIADVNYEVRGAAVHALIRTQQPDTVVAVMQQALRHDPRRHVRTAAMDVLLGYRIVPTCAEFVLFATHVPHIPKAWMAALVDGPASDIAARLEDLYAQQVQTHYPEFTKRIYKYIRQRDDGGDLLRAFVHADNPRLALLGLMAYTTHGETVSPDMLMTLVTHPDSDVRTYMATHIALYVAHDPSVLYTIWYVTDVQFQVALVPLVLAQPVHMRTLLWQSSDEQVRQRVLTLYAKDIHGAGVLVGTMTPTEMTQLACWVHDTRLMQRTIISDIVATWRAQYPDTVS